MPSQSIIDAAITQLLHQGLPVSVRKVHALTGGSLRDVSKALAAWREGQTAPQVRHYTCARFPSLAIGRHIKFRQGVYETCDPAEQALIEGNDWYGGLIRRVPA